MKTLLITAAFGLLYASTRKLTQGRRLRVSLKIHGIASSQDGSKMSEYPGNSEADTQASLARLLQRLIAQPAVSLIPIEPRLVASSPSTGDLHSGDCRSSDGLNDEIILENVIGHAPAPAQRTPQHGKGGDK